MSHTLVIMQSKCIGNTGHLRHGAHQCFLQQMFLLAQLSCSQKLVKYCLSVCLDVNQSGTNHNCCTQRLVILHHRPTNEPWLHGRGHTDLFYLVFRLSQKILISVLSVQDTVTKFASYVHLTRVHQLTDSALLRSTFQGLKFWVNHGGTNHNQCTRRLVFLAHTDLLMNPYCIPKTRSVWPI